MSNDIKPLPTFTELLIKAGHRLNKGEPYHRVMSALHWCSSPARWRKFAPLPALVLYGLMEREVTARESSSPWACEHRMDHDGSEALRHVRRMLKR